MGQIRKIAQLFVPLFAFWILLNGSFAIDSLVIGGLVCAIIIILYRQGLSLLSEFSATPAGFIAAGKYFVFFLKELIKSNIQLAKIVLSPDLPIDPGIVKIRTGLKSSMGRLLLANSITLTPGTLSVELRGEWLYVHWVRVEASEIEAATKRIASGFERHLEVMYG